MSADQAFRDHLWNMRCTMEASRSSGPCTSLFCRCSMYRSMHLAAAKEAWVLGLEVTVQQAKRQPWGQLHLWAIKGEHHMWARFPQSDEPRMWTRSQQCNESRQTSLRAEHADVTNPPTMVCTYSDCSSMLNSLPAPSAYVKASSSSPRW